MIKEFKCYTVICDNCGADSNNDSEISGWGDKFFAVDVAVDADWIINENKHYCPDCCEWDEEGENLGLKVIKTILLLFMPLLGLSQPDTLHLSGYLAGTYTAKHQINIDSAQSQFTWPTILQIGDCDTLDQYIPGIAVLGDSCIRDLEWASSGYSDVIQDSSDFHSDEFMNLCKSFNVAAIDDCGIDSFFVKSVQIIPAGGVDRPGESTREFRIKFRAVDWVGHAKEQVMTWIRKPDTAGCW